MQNNIVAVIASAFVVLSMTGSQNATEPAQAPQKLHETPRIEEILNSVQNPRTRAILTDLVHCESSGNPEAINPKDLDGTPSHGCLQFKPGTLYGFGKEAGLFPDMEPGEIYNVLYDPELQIEVAVYMIEKYGHEQKFWDQQWPGCSKKYHYWKGY